MMELNLTRVDYTQVCHSKPVIMMSDVYMLTLKLLYLARCYNKNFRTSMSFPKKSISFPKAFFIYCNTPSLGVCVG